MVEKAREREREREKERGREGEGERGRGRESLKYPKRCVWYVLCTLRDSFGSLYRLYGRKTLYLFIRRLSYESTFLGRDYMLIIMHTADPREPDLWSFYPSAIADSLSCHSCSHTGYNCSIDLFQNKGLLITLTLISGITQICTLKHVYTVGTPCADSADYLASW